MKLVMHFMRWNDLTMAIMHNDMCAFDHFSEEDLIAT